MGWDDIDFNLIKTGMITSGPATVSFTDYLNTFLIALFERNVFKKGLSEGQEIEIDLFVQFQISDQKKIRDMIISYYNLWSEDTYYNPDVMDDIINYTDYEYTDDHLIAIIGQETYDIIKDVYNRPWYEVYTANVFNALYEIYKLTGYYTTGVSSLPVPFVPADANFRFFTEDNPETQYVTLFDQQGDTYEEAVNNLFDTGRDFSTQSDIRGGYSYRARKFNNQELWEADDTIPYAGQPKCVIKQTDLNGTVIESNIAVAHYISINRQQEEKSKIGFRDTQNLPYVNSFPLVRDLTEAVEEIIFPIKEIGEEGTVFTFETFDFSGQNPKIAPPIFQYDPDFIISGDVRFQATIRGQPIAIELNNPALEFYIAPEE